MPKLEVPRNRQMYSRNHVIVKDDSNFIDVCSTIFFQNQGTTRVIINDHIVLDPLETYTESAGVFCALVEDYGIKFKPLLGASVRAPDGRKIYDGNRLYIRVHKKPSYNE